MLTEDKSYLTGSYNYLIINREFRLTVRLRNIEEEKKVKELHFFRIFFLHIFSYSFFIMAVPLKKELFFCGFPLWAAIFVYFFMQWSFYLRPAWHHFERLFHCGVDVWRVDRLGVRAQRALRLRDCGHHLQFTQQGTGWPVIHGRVFLVPCKQWLVQCTGEQ